MDSGSQEAGIEQDKHSYTENHQTYTNVKVSLKLKKRPIMMCSLTRLVAVPDTDAAVH